MLIGIGDYSGTGLESLKGPANDVALMRTVLMSRFAVPEANIITLQNAQATHSKVQAAFGKLASRVKQGDSVYVYYSGHGSYVPDRSARSGQYETWVTFGARSRKSAGLDDYDVLSKEISQWLAPLYAKSRAVVFVSDSCHSATVSRGLSTGVRAGPPDPRPHPMILQRADTPTSMPGVRIGASRDTESAVELDVEHGGQCLDGSKCQGVFTWYWVQALQQAKPGDRWSDVFNRAYTLVTSQRSVSQRPQLEGQIQGPVFGGSIKPAETTIPVTAVNAASRTVTLAAGLVNGVTKGSVYKLFDSGSPDRAGLPTVEIGSLQPFSSQGAIQSGDFKVGDPVVESTHAFPFEPLRLFVAGDLLNDADQALLARIRTALKTLEGFSVVEDKGRADWVVYVLRPRKEGNRYLDADPARTLPKSFADQPPEVWVISPQEKLLHERMRITLRDEDRGVAALKSNLSSFARAAEIKRLEYRMSPLPVSVEVGAWRADPSCRTACVFLPKDERQERPFSKVGTFLLGEVAPPFKQGDVLTFTLSNKGQERKPWYAYILNISSDSAIQTIFPTQYDNREEALLKAGEVRDLARDVMLQLDAPGDEVIKLIVTNDSIESRLFESTGYIERRAELNPLERLLVKAMTTRADLQKFSVREWGTEQSQYVVAQ